MKTLHSNRPYRVISLRWVQRSHLVAAFALVLAGLLHLSALAQNTGPVHVSARLVSDELYLAGVNDVFVTVTEQAAVQVFWCKDTSVVQQLLDAIAKGTDARIVDRVPNTLSKPSDHLQFDTNSELVTLATYYGNEDLLSIPHFFYRKDRKLTIAPDLSKADREILSWRARQIVVKPDPRFKQLLIRIKTKEYLLGERYENQ